MESTPIITLWGWFHIDIAVWLTIIVTCVTVFVLMKCLTRNLSVENPSKAQGFVEWIVDFVRGIISSTMDYELGKPYVMFGITIILFVFVANLLGLPFSIVIDYTHPASIFGHPIAGLANSSVSNPVAMVFWKSPTADLSVTAGMALMVFVLVHGRGMIKNTRAYFKHYLEPYPIFLPITLVEVFSKPLTHAMRLYGNIFAGELLISVITAMGWASIPFLGAWQAFSVFIGCIQAYVFTILTMVYISQYAIRHEEHAH